MILIDTSVLVAYLCPEALHASARKSLASASQRLITPMIRVEVASALAIKTRTGELNVSSAKEVLHELQRQIDDGIFTLQEIQIGDYRRAYDWLSGFNTPLRAADALHLASAVGLEATLLTADQGLAQSAKILRIPCKLIR